MSQATQLGAKFRHSPSFLQERLEGVSMEGAHIHYASLKKYCAERAMDHSQGGVRIGKTFVHVDLNTCVCVMISLVASAQGKWYHVMPTSSRSSEG